MSEDADPSLFELAAPMPELPSPEEIARAQTAAGGWSRQQLARWGVAWPPPKGWRQDLEERYARSRRSR